MRHAEDCEHRDPSDPAILRVHDRDGYWYVDCSAWGCGWQVPYYAAESVG